MNTVDHHGHNQFAVYFAAQPVFLAGIGVMYTKNGLYLFKQELNLPSQTVKGPDHFGRQPFLWHISDH